MVFLPEPNQVVSFAKPKQTVMVQYTVMLTSNLLPSCWYEDVLWYVAFVFSWKDLSQHSITGQITALDTDIYR